MKRRALLRYAGVYSAVGCVGIAGCVGDDDPKETEIDDDPPADGVDDNDEDLEHYEITFLAEETTIEIAANKDVLSAGLDEGIDIPYSCLRGECGVCTSRIDGDATELVTHTHQQFLSGSSVEEGYMLPCTAYPRGDFSIDVGNSP